MCNALNILNIKTFLQMQYQHIIVYSRKHFVGEYPVEIYMVGLTIDISCLWYKYNDGNVTQEKL